MGDVPLVIGGWLADREGVGYYRVRVPLEALERRGHSVEIDDYIPWRAGKRPASHVLVGQRISNEGPSRHWISAAGDVRRVFELDDLLLDVDPSSVRPFEYYSDPGRRRRLLENMRSADVVTVSTPYLADAVRADYGVTAPVFVLPNCLEPQVFDLPPVDQSGPMTVGWSGSDTHRADVMLLRRPLSRFLARHPEVGVTLAGVDYRRELGAPRARVLGWHPIWSDAVGYYARMDWQVTLAPLVSHHFNRAKSALRALEAGARGSVVIASDVEPYSNYVQDGVTGFLIRRDHEWMDRLELLRSDEGLRARMAVAAREQAAGWRIDEHAHLWEAAYRGE